MRKASGRSPEALLEDRATGNFLLDHDQRNTASCRALPELCRITCGRRPPTSSAPAFSTATGPAHLPPHSTFDLSIGKRFGENWTVSANAVNIANTRYLLDTSNTFGGTHYINPRQIYGECATGSIYNGSMFFRRQTPQKLTFQQRLDSLKQAGFTVAQRPDGSALVSRGDCAIGLRNHNDQVLRTERAGILIGNEIASLVDGGYQKFFRTASGKTKPALASELKDLHEFEEDLKQGLCLENFYNESLGTVSTFYMYDRVKDRDRGVPKRVWEE